MTLLAGTVMGLKNPSTNVARSLIAPRITLNCVYLVIVLTGRSELPSVRRYAILTDLTLEGRFTENLSDRERVLSGWAEPPGTSTIDPGLTLGSAVSTLTIRRSLLPES